MMQLGLFDEPRSPIRHESCESCAFYGRTGTVWYYRTADLFTDEGVCDNPACTNTSRVSWSREFGPRAEEAKRATA